MSDAQEPRIAHRIELSAADVDIIDDAVSVLAELDTVRRVEMTSQFYATQYDNLQIVVRDLLLIFKVAD